MPDAVNYEALTQLLRWYADMGVDMAIDDQPHDRFAESQNPPPTPPSAPAPPPRVSKPARAPQPVTAPPARIEDLTQQVSNAGSLDELREQLLAFEGCGLKATATQLVFADGNPEADIMFVGEAPGAEEDRIGRPFVGLAGQLLDKMLATIELDRTKVYIANVVPWRPPGNRTPTPLETGACLPFTRRQIELVAPKILICLGAPSMQTLLGIKDGIIRRRGRWVDYNCGGAIIQAMPMFHPAYLLRTPSQKKFAWQDLRELAKKMRSI